MVDNLKHLSLAKKKKKSEISVGRMSFRSALCVLTECPSTQSTIGLFSP